MRALSPIIVAKAVAALVLLQAAHPVMAETALVAVATNFREVIERLKGDFERETGHGLRVAGGSTGKLYAQIVNGAPFDAFLSADRAAPERLEQAGLAVPGTRFTYATGRLALWSPRAGGVGADGVATLREANFRKLAMANPAVAPYGAAARQTLRSLGLYEALRPKIVMGENIGQAHALVATGNAELGFVALASVLGPHHDEPGSRWDVPPSLHDPIAQDAVLLARAEDNSAARDLLAYLRRPEVRELIRSFGYGVD